jgi:outer membrane lipoprotein-sorting protein
MQLRDTLLVCLTALLLTGLPALAQSQSKSNTEPEASQAAQAPTASKPQPASKQPESARSNSGLERVLAAMDKTAAEFRSAEADFVWDQYQKVVDEHDLQKGKVYFRRQGHEIQMAADITEPAKKYVLFSGGRVQVYQPVISQVTEYNVAKNRQELESFLVLGFGGSGHDLLKQYDVKYLGTEQVDGVNAEKLQLIPKSVKVRNNVERILLWIDPARGVSVRQQFFEPSGDYRLSKYSNIQLNAKIPDNVFKLKTDAKTKVISPQS